jgi:hypothetical protein
VAEALLTIDDIAKRFKTSRRNVAERWIHKPDFPQPRYAPTQRTRLWLATDVERWATPAGQRSLPPARDSTCSEES